LQWSSPTPIENNGHTDNHHRRREDSKGNRIVRRRKGPDFEDGSGGNGSLRYGSDSSDHDEDGAVSPSGKTRRSADASVLTTSNNASLTKSGETSTRPPQVVFREDWKTKQERVRAESAYGSHPGWRLLPILIKANDDLRQEQLASQLIYRMAAILAHEKVNVWLYNYEIIALTETGGIIEASK
jgi:hypothetical protein